MGSGGFDIASHRIGESIKIGRGAAGSRFQRVGDKMLAETEPQHREDKLSP